jgi:hypothetical protein
MTRARNRAATAFDVLLLGAGGLIAYTSWGYGFGTLARPGPGLYPFFVGAVIAAFAGILLASHLKSPPQHESFEEGEPATLLWMAAIFCFWIIAMPLLGYVVVTAIATFAFGKTMKLEGSRKPLALAGGTALFIYLLFDKWLYIDLPRGIFGS